MKRFHLIDLLFDINGLFCPQGYLCLPAELSRMTRIFLLLLVSNLAVWPHGVASGGGVGCVLVIVLLLSILLSFTFDFYVQDILAVVAYGHAVGDEDDCFLFCLHYILQQLALCLRVESCCRLVEKHDGAVSQQGSRYCYALCLSF